MAKVSVDNIIERVRAIFGDAPGDEELSILEDMRDSLTGTDEDMETRIREIEEKWRKRYADRFLGVKIDEDEIREPGKGEKEKKIKIDDLFEERGDE